MPTETVYGLAADALSSEAVAKIFELKGRPSTNPLIVHVVSVDVGERYAVFDDRARKLFAAFSPGPLTVVLPKCFGSSSAVPQSGEGTGNAPALHSAIGNPQSEISPLVSAGLSTVGIRIPNHPLALELLGAFDGPLAAPSANKSNHVSPTTAQHVREEFGDELFVLDGGPCRVGIESTVLDLSRPVPIILRPGDVSRERIEAVIGPVEVFSGVVETGSAATSPGQSRVHYAPRSPAYRFDMADLPALRRVARPRSALVVLGDISLEFDWASASKIAIGSDPEVAASRFYAAMREVDALSPEAIFIEMPPDEPRWAALRDRITRATSSAEQWIASRRMP